MADPRTATDAEVDEWLAVHCMGWYREVHPNGVEYYFNDEGQRESDPSVWHPTSDYDDLRMCEDKVQDTWDFAVRYLRALYEYEATAENIDGGNPTVTVMYRTELSARARLVMAILQEENGG